MLHLTILLLLFSLVECQRIYTGTKGHVWPAPRFEEKASNVFYTLEPSSFKVKTTLHSCATLVKAVKRSFLYVKTLRRISLKMRRKYSGDPFALNYNATTLSGLSIELTNPCEKYPYFNMDESYTLLVTKSPLLTSGSIWGIIRGLETFSQLFFISEQNTLVIQGTHIADSPRYPHRGLLLDTARHYISPHKIQVILDAMAMNKMNVFHWHIVDDQSFPFASEKFPEMSEKGAFHPAFVYTKEMIQDIVEYARSRGIRIIPEFDIPGHSRSWGASHPEILVKCPGAGLMDPIKKETHELVRELLQEVQEWFPDQYLHLGGDEVNHTCWYDCPNIEKFMIRNNFLSTKQLQGLFMKKAVSYLRAGTVPIVWQVQCSGGRHLLTVEGLDAVVASRVAGLSMTKLQGVRGQIKSASMFAQLGGGTAMSPDFTDLFQNNRASLLLASQDTVVQVWKKPNAIAETIKLLNSGHRVIFSSYWYLDHLDNTFAHMYKDPRKQVVKLDDDVTINERDVIGGEACMWTEMVDDTNVISVIWPRASAAAEILWSAEPQYEKHETYQRELRIEEQVCRMRTRDIPVPPPNGPGFCLTDLDLE